MNFKQLFDYEIRLSRMLGADPKVAYTYKGLLMLRAHNYRLRARKAPLKTISPLIAYSLSIKQLTALPASLAL